MEWGKIIRQDNMKQFLLRASLLLACFVLISFIIGGVIVPGPLLYTLGFFVYGGLGYIFLAMTIFFVVLAREKLLHIETAKGYSWLFGVLTIALVAAFYFFGSYVKANPFLASDQPLLYGAALHSIFILMFVSLGFTFFNTGFVKRFARDFKRELIICGIVGLVFYAAMRLVWKAWPILSYGVSKVVRVMLEVFPGDVTLIPPQTLIVKGFAVYIGEACSGVFSIFLFTSLFLLIVALDWKKLHAGRAVVMFFLAVIGLFFVNVLRVYIIIVYGALFSPEIAINLFHSYAGMILFMLFFIAFMWFGYDWMKSADNKAVKNKKHRLKNKAKLPSRKKK